MVFDSYRYGVDGKQFVYLKEVNDNDASLLEHLGFRHVESIDVDEQIEEGTELWVKHENNQRVFEVSSKGENCWGYEANELEKKTRDAINDILDEYYLKRGFSSEFIYYVMCTTITAQLLLMQMGGYNKKSNNAETEEH